MASGHTIHSMTEEENEEYAKHFRANSKDKMIKFQPGGWFMPETFVKYADKYYEFEYHPSDVVISTFPKCGTSWTQEIVWTLRHNLDFQRQDSEEAINFRVPFIELDGLFGCKNERTNSYAPEILDMFKERFPGKDPNEGVYLEIAKNMSHPRTLKTHLPFSLLNPLLIDTAKVIFIARNPKDTLVSFLHHHRMSYVYDYVGDLDTFLNYFIKDEVYNSPYWTMIHEAWEQKSHPNMLFLYYEDMKEDAGREINRIAKFLNINLTKEQLSKVIHHTSFDQMKKRNNVLGKNDSEIPIFKKEVTEKDGHFFRKGTVGDGEKTLTAEQSKKVDDWTRKNTKNMKELKYFINE